MERAPYESEGFFLCDEVCTGAAQLQLVNLFGIKKYKINLVILDIMLSLYNKTKHYDKVN